MRNFQTSQMPHIADFYLLHASYLSLNHNFLLEVVSCEAGRRLKIRSLPSVNEEFSGKPDATDDLLSQEIYLFLGLSTTKGTIISSIEIPPCWKVFL